MTIPPKAKTAGPRHLENGREQHTGIGSTGIGSAPGG
jgi:hypothetical protein